MTCITGQGFAICGSWDKPDCRRIFKCYACKRRTRHVRHFDGLWYGHTDNCVACAGRSQDGYFIPWGRGKKDRIVELRERWTKAMTRAEYEAYVHAESEAEFAYMRGEDG